MWRCNKLHVFLSWVSARLGFLLWVVAVLAGLCACSKTDTAVTVQPQEDIPNHRQRNGENAYARISANQYAAVASVHPLATEAGLNAIAAGGNAVDAALAVAFTLGVVDSHNSGIGGGCFILLRQADGTLIAIDGREMAPAAAFRDMYLRDGRIDGRLSKTGALAVGIPGSVQALFELQKMAGRLSFSDVILPAAEIAAKGFAIDKVLAARLEKTQDDLRKFPASAAIYLPGDRVLSPGDTLIQKDLAKTYRHLAKWGPDYFYRGEFAKQAAAWMAANGGVITVDDFAHYTIKRREPIVTEFQGYEVVGFPPPSSGGVHVGQILAMLDPFDLSAMSDIERYHLLIETSKRAFADRAYWLGDADFVSVPRGLLDRSYAQARMADFQPERVSHGIKYGIPDDAAERIFNKHTTHIAAADKDGNWVAITTTLNTSFGSKVTVPGTGVLLNNQMDDFSAQPGVPNAFGLVGAEANAIAAGKRPLSSMSPTIILRDGQPLMTLGAAGGPTIISQVVQTIVNHLALQMPLQAAMETVRVHHQWLPDKVFIDAFAPLSLQQGLQAKGHDLQRRHFFGATQAISRLSASEGWQVESEPRIQ